MKKLSIFLIACIVLIAVLGLVTGMFYGNNLNTPAAINSSNNTTVNSTISSVNNTPSTNETTMTPEEAMDRVNNELSGYYKATSAVLINGTPNPLYKVHIIHIKPNDYGKDGGYVTVDTVTGFVNHKGV